MKSSKSSSCTNNKKLFFLRARWKHYTRWVAFLLLAVIDFGFVGSAIHYQGNSLQVLAVANLARASLAIFMIILCNLFVLPSIVMEVDSIQVNADGIVICGLVFWSKERWDDLSLFIAPIWLKFAILKGKFFYYLINKRDIGNYAELSEILCHKAVKLSKQ